MLFPEIKFLTNDSWPLVRGLAAGNGYPILLMGRYSKGILFVWTIPENFNDLYEMPPPVVSEIKDYILGDFPVRLDGPGKVSLFAYDNDTFVVESFLEKEAEITVSTTGGFTMLKDLVTGELINGQSAPARRLQQGLPGAQRRSFKLNIKPHSYRVFTEAK